MNRSFIITASLIGALSVIFGAFGAHSLRTIAAPQDLEVFDTAVRYQFYHVGALFIVGLLWSRWPNNWMRAAGRLFIAGIILFSGSLYLLVFFHISSVSAQWVGMFTPLGGISLICGWGCIAIACRK